MPMSVRRLDDKFRADQRPQFEVPKPRDVEDKHKQSRCEHISSNSLNVVPLFRAAVKEPGAANYKFYPAIFSLRPEDFDFRERFG
jgi:hypothetical protein